MFLSALAASDRAVMTPLLVRVSRWREAARLAPPVRRIAVRAQTECAGLERGGTAEDVPQACQRGCLWYLCWSEKSLPGARN